MRKKIMFVCLVIFVSIKYGFAQDPNFSQFFSSPMTLNPALTGKFDGDIRFAANYRNQWPSINNAFVTATASLDFNILQNYIPTSDQFGVGLMAFNDKAGGGALNTTYYALSLAYHKGLDEDGMHQIGLGFQGSFFSKRLNTSLLTFQDQLTTNGFTGVTSETFSSQQVKLSYFDLNTGVLYTGSTNGYNHFYFGASLYHANKPKESFNDGNYLLNSRLTLQAGAMLPIGEYNSLHLATNYSTQAKAKNMVFGGAFGLNLNNNLEAPTNLFLGSWVRFQDAIIPYIGLEVGDWQFGATYDVNISSLKAASNLKGGIEFSIIYIRKKPDRSIKRIGCPKF